MKNHRTFRFAVGSLLLILAGCKDSTLPLEPPGELPSSPVTAASLCALPRITGTALIYDRVANSSNIRCSRYVLYEDSTFELQTELVRQPPTAPYYKTGGRYSRADSTVWLNFAAANWSAVGTLRGDSLRVRYNETMHGADFEDGVYLRLLDRSGYIHTANADGSSIKPLTRGSWPSWAPDGRRIAFQRDGAVHVVDANGSNEIRLTAGAFPAWSPDGERIAFASAEGISVMSADGSGVTTLLLHRFRNDTYEPWDMGVGKPSWSPDGKRIAFEHQGDGDTQGARIYVMNADGSNPRPLTSSPDGRRYPEIDPAWSPDGAEIAFWSYGYGVARVKATGGDPIGIYMALPGVGYSPKPAWSPAGDRLAFTAHYRTAPMGPVILVVPAKGGKANPLIQGGFDAAWSPDGASIAFVSRRGE